jgi:hypothetical protein
MKTTLTVCIRSRARVNQNPACPQVGACDRSEIVKLIVRQQTSVSFFAGCARDFSAVYQLTNVERAKTKDNKSAVNILGQIAF